MLGTICLTLAIDDVQDAARYKKSGFDVATKPEIEILQQNGWMKFGEKIRAKLLKFFIFLLLSRAIDKSIQRPCLSHSGVGAAFPAVSCTIRATFDVGLLWLRPAMAQRRLSRPRLQHGQLSHRELGGIENV